MSTEKVKAFYNEFKISSAQMQKELPDMVSSFMNLFQSVMKDGALDIKTKELIALSVALALQCEPCIYLHVQKSLAAGASRQEILEATSVVVMMQGGPAFTHVPPIIHALDALGA